MYIAVVALLLLPLSLFGLARSRGVPSGWTEDFEAAKITAAKEGKHILMCSITSDSYYGQRLVKEVYSQGKFSGKAKKRFVLVMVDLASDVRNLSPLAIRQNPKLRDEYNLFSSGDIRILDSDGVVLRRVPDINGDANSYWVKLDAETQGLPVAKKKTAEQIAAAAKGAEKSSAKEKAGDKKNGKPKDPKLDEPLTRIEGTGPSTPAGWMDDFFAAQEIAKRENKLIFTVFSGSDWCGWCKEYSNKVLSVPRFIRSVSDRYVLVYIDSPNDQSLLSAKCREQNKMVSRMLGARGGVPHTVITTPDAKKLTSISGCNQAARQGADSFLEFFNGLDASLKLICEAREKTKDMDSKSPAAVKILHEALQKMDEDVMVSSFIEEAEFVVEQDPSLLKSYPYLEHVKPIKEEYEKLMSDLSSETRKQIGSSYTYEQSRKARKKLMSEKQFSDRFQALLQKIDDANSKLPANSKSKKHLLNVKTNIYAQMNDD